jgi:hypothetical protein
MAESTMMRFLRGTADLNDSFTGPEGAITIDTTNWTIRIHDGVTPGGQIYEDKNKVIDRISAVDTGVTNLINRIETIEQDAPSVSVDEQTLIGITQTKVRTLNIELEFWRYRLAEINKNINALLEDNAAT